MFIIVIDDDELKLILDNILSSSSTVSPQSPQIPPSPQSPQIPPSPLSPLSQHSALSQRSPSITLHSSPAYHAPRSPLLPPPPLTTSQSSIPSTVVQQAPIEYYPISPQSPLFSQEHYSSPFGNNIKIEDCFDLSTDFDFEFEF